MHPPVKRPSVISGTWYPGDAEALNELIDSQFQAINKIETSLQIKGLIAPHAGYAYSGAVAAHAYRQVLGAQYDYVIVLSPSHHYTSAKYVVNINTHYSTPLGDVPVALDVLSQLNIAFEGVIHDDEHAIEIQLPFLQKALGRFELLPIMTGPLTFEEADDLIDAIHTLLAEKNALIVISTDMHHISSYHAVCQKDMEIRQALENYDLELLTQLLESKTCTVCGRLPLMIGLTALKQAGHQRINILKQINSGDVTGIKAEGEYTVGYLSAMIT